MFYLDAFEKGLITVRELQRCHAVFTAAHCTLPLQS
jgi:hypothetical protein